MCIYVCKCVKCICVHVYIYIYINIVKVLCYCKVFIRTPPTTHFLLSFASFFCTTSGTLNHFNKRRVSHTFLSPSLLSHSSHVEPPTTLIKEGSTTLTSLFRFVLLQYMWNPQHLPGSLAYVGYSDRR